MIPPEIIKKIRKVHLKTSRLVSEMMAGQYRSVFKGSGIEFEEVRDYSPGDDTKTIDWKVSARLGRPFVKLFREERELIIMLLVDMSNSEKFGTTGSSKKNISAEIAALLAFNAIRNNDKVGAILFTDQVDRYIPPKKGTAHIWRVIKEIYTFQSGNTKTDIQHAIRYLGRVSRKRATVFLISDFLSPAYRHQLKVAAKKYEFIAVLLSDPGDFTMPERGIVSIQDLESGTTAFLDAGNKKHRQAFEQIRRSEYNAALEILRSLKIDCIEISTESDSADSLFRYFMRRNKRIH